jgi:hypothetical protein
VKIQIDNIDDACQGKGYSMETSSTLRAEIDMTSVFESIARVTLSVRSNALYWLMSYGQKSSGAVASWSHSQRRQSDFTAQYLLQYGSTYRFFFYALLKPCVDIVQSYTTPTEVPQCISQGNSTEAMDVANGCMTQAMYVRVEACHGACSINHHGLEESARWLKCVLSVFYPQWVVAIGKVLPDESDATGCERRSH